MNSLKYAVQERDIDQGILSIIKKKHPGFNITDILVEDLEKGSKKYTFYLTNGTEKRVTELEI